MTARKPRKGAICWPLVVVGGLCSGPAVGGDYHLVLGVDQLLNYDDNVDFRRNNEIDATSYTLSPQLDLDGKTERWDLGVALETPFERYTEDRLNSDNQNLDVHSLRRLERGELLFSAGVLRDSTHRAEEETSGVTSPVAQRYVRDAFSGSWNRRLGERNQISFGGSAQKSNYDSLTLHDYEYGSVQVGWSHVINPRLTSQLTVFDSHLSSEVDPAIVLTGTFPQLVPVSLPLPDSTTDTVGVQGGLTRIFSERLQGSFMVGWRNLDTTSHEVETILSPDAVLTPVIAEINGSDNGGLGSASVTYTGSRFELTTTLSVDLSPSGLGVLFERDQLLADFEYHLRERLSLRLHVIAYDNKSTDESFVYERKYYRVTPNVRWRFKQRWTLTGGFEVRGQEQEDAPGRATSNSVFMALAYSTDPIPIFR